MWYWYAGALLLWFFGVAFVFRVLENRGRKNEEAEHFFTAVFWPIWILFKIAIAILTPPANVVFAFITSLANLAGDLADVFFPPKKRGRPKGGKNKRKG